MPEQTKDGEYRTVANNYRTESRRALAEHLRSTFKGQTVHRMFTTLADAVAASNSGHVEAPMWTLRWRRDQENGDVIYSWE